MINLLSDERKAAIRAARSNIIILRYMAIVALAFAFIAGAVYISYSLLQSTMSSAEERVAANDVKADVYKETKQQVDELSIKLNDAKVIADEEVLYSQVLIKMGQLVPIGAVLGDLSLDSSHFTGTPVQITAYAKTMAEATQLQSNFQGSPLFTQVTLNSTENDKGTDDYPVYISLTATFNKAGL